MSRDRSQRPPLPHAGYMEDYTTPFLVTAGVLCFVVLLVVWALIGLPFTVALALLADRLLLRR